MKVCVLGASFGSENRGVGALANGIVESVLAQNPETELVFFDYARQPGQARLNLSGREILIPVRNIRFSKNIFLKNNIARLLTTALLLRIIPSAGLREKVRSRNESLKEMSEAGAVLAISGGDSFSDIYGLRRFVYVSLPQLLAILLRKPLVLLPQTIGPFRTCLARKAAGFIMRNARLVYSRDHEGLQTIRDMTGEGIHSERVRFCYDVAFAMGAQQPASPEADLLLAGRGTRPMVGVNISGLLLAGGYFGKNDFRLKVNYRELIEDLLRLFILEKDADVLLVPHVFGAPGNMESDTTACRVVYEALKDRYPGRLFLLSENYSEREIKHVIGRMDFFVGSRMHSCIAALTQEIPSVPIAYSRKFDGVLASIGMTELVADLRTLDEVEILLLISGAFDKRDAIRTELGRRIRPAKTQVAGLFGEILNHAHLSPVTAD